jgi:hypothetical protein
MILVLEILLFLRGLWAVISGQFHLGGNIGTTGLGARLAGLICALCLPCAAVGGYWMGQNWVGTQQEFYVKCVVMELLLLGVCTALALVVVYFSGSGEDDDSYSLLTPRRVARKKVSKRKKQLDRIFSMAVVAVVVIGCVGGFIWLITKAMAPADLELKEYVSEKGGFKVLLPDNLKESTNSSTEGNLTAQLNMVSWEVGNRSINVAFSDVPIPPGENPGQIQIRLTGARDGMMKRFPSSSLLSEKNITLANKYPGREVRIQITQPQGALIHSRYYLVGTRMYWLMAAGPEWHVNSPQTVQVLDSFALTGAPQPTVPNQLASGPHNNPSEPVNKETPQENDLAKKPRVWKGPPLYADSLAQYFFDPVTSENLQVLTINVSASQLAPCLCWAPDGKSFYCLEKTPGILRKISFPSFRNLVSVPLDRSAIWLSLSGLGPVVTVSNPPEMLLLDPDTLQVKNRFPLWDDYRAVSNFNLPLAYAAPVSSRPAKHLLAVIDLTRNQVVNQYYPQQIGKSGSFEMPQVTPDGRYLFTRSGSSLNRFRIQGLALFFEENSGTLGVDLPDEIPFSLDGSLCARPSPNGGNAIFPVHNLKAPAFSLGQVGSPVLGFDIRNKVIYANSLTRFDFSGATKMQFPISQRSEPTRQILIHPEGNKMLLLQDSKLLYVEVY